MSASKNKFSNISIEFINSFDDKNWKIKNVSNTNRDFDFNVYGYVYDTNNISMEDCSIIYNSILKWLNNKDDVKYIDPFMNTDKQAKRINGYSKKFSTVSEPKDVCGGITVQNKIIPINITTSDSSLKEYYGKTLYTYLFITYDLSTPFNQQIYEHLWNVHEIKLLNEHML